MSLRPACLTAITLSIVFFCCFYGLGHYPLLDNNDGMYASIALAMAKGGDLIIPHLNGVPYIEKPPLLYWLVALAFKIFGVGEWQARLVSATALCAIVLATWRFLARHESANAGRWAALVLCTSLPFVIFARFIYFDMLLALFVVLALMAFYEWFVTQRLTWLRIAYGCAALALLAKGLVALLLIGGTAVTFCLVEHAPRIFYRRALDLWGILLFLCVALPWHIAAALSEPGFAWFYFINEHLLRFLNLREPHDYYTGPIWYYLPRIFLALLPWSLGLPLLIRAPNTQLTRFLWGWFGWMLCFFSLSQAKANYYMLAAIPALGMLLALQLHRKLPLRIGLPIALALLLLWPLAIRYIAHENGRFSQKEVALYLAGQPAAPVALYRDFETFSALAFYMPTPLTLVDSDSKDLLYGQQQAKNDTFIALADWVGRTQKTGVSRLIVGNRRLLDLRTRLESLPAFKRMHIEVVSFARVSVVTLTP